MERTIKQCSFDVLNRISCQHTIFHGLFYTFFNRTDIFFWNSTANYLVFKYKSFSFFIRFNSDPNMSKLSSAAGLPDELTFLLNFLRDRFLICHLGLTYISLYFKFSFKPVNYDL